MRKLLLAILFAISATNFVAAQTWMANIPPASSRNFYTIKKAFEDYWADKKPTMLNGDNEEEGGDTTGDGSYLQFERWANFIEPRVFPTGNFFDPTILQKEFEKYNSRISTRSGQTDSLIWTFVGPDVIPGGGGDAGRIDCIAISPKDTATIFVGAASGGLWMSNNSGKTWLTTTDLLPSLSIADIAINPNNTDTMYVATGDGYGYTLPEGNDQVFWGGTYSAGVMKSVDGGNTWQTTGLGYTQDEQDIINRLLINPTNPNILLAATHNGIYQSTDAGNTWIEVATGTFFDMAFNTANADTVYAVNATDVYKSSDAGATWSVIANGLFTASDRTTISTTAADPSVIYVMNVIVIGQDPATGNLYRSGDGGKSFTACAFPSGTYFYGYYDGVMRVSPADANTLYCGGLELYKSADGGQTWNIADNTTYPATNYVHVDKHTIVFYPNSTSDVLCGNDGGIFKTTNGDNTWTDLSSGLAIKQYYRISSSASDAAFIYAGAQDVGTDRYNGTSWQSVYGYDGMQPIVDYTNDNIDYASYAYGDIVKSIDGGGSFVDITPGSAGYGSFVTPYFLNPTHHNTIFAGYSSVFRSYEAGKSGSWVNLNSPNNTGGEITSMAMAPSDSNYIYVGFYGDLIKTTNGGTSWTDITGSLPVNACALTWIAVSSYDPQKLWITFSGFTSGSKVFYSGDGGSTWTNYSGSLPNVPANCIAYQPGSKDLLYVGTDLGVFMRDSTMGDWVTYNTGLPNVIIDQLEVVPYAEQLRAATYGRGIWETELHQGTTGIATINSIKDNVNVYPNPSSGLFTVSVSSKQQDNLLVSVVNVLGETVLETQQQIQNGANQFNLDLSQQAKGVYFIRLNSGSQNIVKKVILTD